MEWTKTALVALILLLIMMVAVDVQHMNLIHELRINQQHLLQHMRKVNGLEN